MQITEVRIKLAEGNAEDGERLRAFATVLIDDSFAVRDIRIVEGSWGLFLAMPSRKITDRCEHCGIKNYLRSRFCNHCGCRLDENRAPRDENGRSRLHADIAHPVTSSAREALQDAVLEAYYDELEASSRPGYASSYDVNAVA